MLAQRLRNERKKARLTQAQLGEKLGLTQQAIGKWEKGLAEPDISSINKLAELFQCNPNYLLGNTTDPTPQNEKGLVYDDEAWELMRDMHERPELKALFKTSKNVKPEDIKAVDELLKHMAEESGF